MALSVEAIESLDGLRAIDAEWGALWERDPLATPFQGPDWLLPWTESLWGGGRLLVLAARSGRLLVAVAPLFRWGYGEQPQVVRVSFLGSGISDHLGITVLPGFEPGVARAILDRLAEMRSEWDECDFQELRPGSPLLRAGMPPDFETTQTPSSVCPVLALPRSADELYAGLDARFRRSLRVADNRLQREGAEFAPVTAPDACVETMRELFRLHEARWRDRSEPGVLAAEAVRRFHVEAVARLARRGVARMFALNLRGETIAVQYNLRRGSRVYAYLSGFDPAHARSSPGAALLAYSIRAAIDEGAEEFDFLRQKEEFKYQWGARDQTNRRLVIRHAAGARGMA